MIKIAHMRARVDADARIINTCHNGEDWMGGLSPFTLGPVPLFIRTDGPDPKMPTALIDEFSFFSRNMENAWQFAKVYEEHADANGNPTQAYWDWAIKGWNSERAYRYPMGRGRKPLYSLWGGEKLGYVEARKRIYAPLYARAVVKTHAYGVLHEMNVTHNGLIILRDWDGYDRGDHTLTQVLNDPHRKMGHAFVLEMLLTDDPALQECGISPHSGSLTIG